MCEGGVTGAAAMDHEIPRRDRKRRRQPVNECVPFRCPCSCRRLSLETIWPLSTLGNGLGDGRMPLPRPLATTRQCFAKCVHTSCRQRMLTRASTVPLPRWRPRRPQGLRDPAPHHRDQEPVRHQGDAVPDLARSRQDAVQLEVLLLHHDPRGSRLPPGVAPPPCRDRPGHAHQATAVARASPRHDGRGGSW